MIEFVCTPPAVRMHNMVGMVTMHFHIAHTSLCLGTFFSHSDGGGGMKQFGTNLKLSWECKVGQIRFCGIGYPTSVLI